MRCDLRTAESLRADTYNGSRQAVDQNLSADDAGVPVELVPASSMNFKVTLPEDFALCRRLLK